MPRVLICGSINADIVARVARLPEPGETVAGSDLQRYPGGKGANQAVAAARAGADVVMLGAVGDDAAGADLVAILRDHGVDTSHVLQTKTTPTGTALILVDDAGHNIITVIGGANATVDESLAVKAPIVERDVLVAQFETPQKATVRFFTRGREMGATCVLNPAPFSPLSEELLGLTNVLVVNEPELCALTNRPLRDQICEPDVAETRTALTRTGFTGTLIVTLGPRGVIAMDRGEIITTPGHRVQALDTTGAGDCFVGFLAAELAAGTPMAEASRYANAAAALCVQRPGASPAMPHGDEVTVYLQACKRLETPAFGN